MKTVFFSITIFLIALACSCNDKDQDNTPDIKFEGVLLTDNEGRSFGTTSTLGDNDLNDWSKDADVPQIILNLLDFEDNLSLSGTKVGNIQDGIGYPNPTNNQFTVSFYCSELVKFKLIIVNEQFELLEKYSKVGNKFAFNVIKKENRHEKPQTQYARILQGFGGFDLHDESKYPNSSIFRAYYSFSAENNHNFHVGHGDILVCRSSFKDCENNL